MGRRAVTSLLAAAAVLTSAGAVVLAGSAQPDPVVPHGRPQVRPVTTATLSCPASPAQGGPPTSVFAVGPDTTAPTGGTSRLTVSGSDAATAQAVAETATPGVPLRAALSGAATDPSALVTARGSLARGVTAAQLSLYSGKTTSGLAASWCSSPQDEWWFSGVDTAVGTTTGLVLSNPSPAVVLVDLQLFGPNGVIAAAGATGIAVAPESRKVLDLARYAPGHDAVTLHVTATRGTVVAAVSATRLTGITPTGAEWFPPGGAPARTVVVDAGAEGAGGQSLVVTNPGPRQQLVGVRILAEDGPFTSTQLTSVEVPPGAVRVRAIGAITGGHATAVELTAAGPVTGALVSDLSGGSRDFAVSTGSEPLDAPAVVPTLPGTTLTLAFASAVPGLDEVRIHGVDRSGQQVVDTQVSARGATTTTWSPEPGSDLSYVVLTVPPGSRLQAVATYAGDGGITQLPVISGRWTVTHPAVIP